MQARLLVAAILGAAVCAALTAGSVPPQPRIPLCQGLTIVGAVREPEGDYEPIITIESMDARSLTAKYAAQVAAPAGGAIRNVRVKRTVLLEDLRSATLFMRWYSVSAPETIPGSTAFGVSAAVLRGLKTRGTSQLALVDRGNSAMTADRKVHPNVYDYQVTYTLRRAGSGPVTVPVTVNGVKADLPVIHARGEYLGDKVEFFFLDDEHNPMSLAFRSTPLGASTPDTDTRVVKIAHRCPDPAGSGYAAPPTANRLERALAETGRVDVYDIYFDFNSDRIREESGATLREIADVLRRHPEWRLSIEGHTDDIGNDARNLQLSARRAASVKQALTASHAVDTRRLATAGFGESRPKDTNETLEGRARNRRVELVRAR